MKRELRLAWEWLQQWWKFGIHLIRNAPVEAENSDGSLAWSEQWSRKQKIRVFRPRYGGLMKRRKCGCSTRFGRAVLINMDCEKHGFPNWRDQDEETP